MTAAIRSRGLSKRAGSVPLVDDVELVVGPAECVGVSGPRDRAGVRMLLRILATLVRPSSGTLEVCGIDAVRNVFSARARLAYVGDEPAVGSGLRAGEYLEFVRDARGAAGSQRRLATVDETLARAGMSRHVPVDALPRELRRRLAAAAALMVAPDVLLLDEAFGRLDQPGRGGFIEWLRDVRDGGTAVVIALDQAVELEPLCHRIVQFESGRMTKRVQAFDALPAEDRCVAAWAVGGA